MGEQIEVIVDETTYTVDVESGISCRSAGKSIWHYIRDARKRGQDGRAAFQAHSRRVAEAQEEALRNRRR